MGFSLIIILGLFVIVAGISLVFRMLERIGQLENRVDALEAKATNWAAPVGKAFQTPADSKTVSGEMKSPMAPPPLPAAFPSISETIPTNQPAPIPTPPIRPVMPPLEPEVATVTLTENAGSPRTATAENTRDRGTAAVHAPASPVSDGPAWMREGLESLMGKKGILWIGMLMVLISGGFLLRNMIEHNIIGPLGRVMLWAAFSTAFLVVGEIFRRRRYAPLFQTLTGGGIAGYFSCIYFAMHVHHLISPETAMIIAAGVAAFSIALGVFRDTQAIALMALIGGFLSPLIFSSGENQPYSLFLYMLALSSLALGGAFFRRWHWVNRLAFGCSWLMYGIWFNEYYQQSQIVPAMLFGTIFYVFFAVVASSYSLWRQEAGNGGEIALIIANTTAALAAYWRILYTDHEGTLGYVVIGQAVFTFLLYRFWMERVRTDREIPRILLVVTILLVFLAVPVQLEAYGIPLAWAAEGVALSAAGYWLKDRILRAGGVAAGGLAVIGLLVRLPLHTTEAPFLWNTAFMCWILVAAAWAVMTGFLTWKLSEEDGEGLVLSDFGALGTVLLTLAAFSLEIGSWWYLRRVACGEVWYLSLIRSLMFFYTLFFIVVNGLFYGINKRWLSGSLLGIYILPLVVIMAMLIYPENGLPLFVRVGFGVNMFVVSAWIFAGILLARLSEEEFPQKVSYMGVASIGTILLLPLVVSFAVYDFWYARQAEYSLWATYAWQSILAWVSLFAVGLTRISHRLSERWAYGAIPVTVSLLLLISNVALFWYQRVSTVVFFNPAFGSCLFGLIAIGVLLYSGRRAMAGGVLKTIEIIAECLLAALLLMEWSYWTEDKNLFAVTMVSVSWAVMALILVVVGLIRGTPFRRYFGFILFGVTVFKVILVDTTELEQYYRILSWMACGMLLIIAGYAYNRLGGVLETDKREEKES